MQCCWRHSDGHRVGLNVVDALLEDVGTLTRHGVQLICAERLSSRRLCAERVDGRLHFAKARHLPQWPLVHWHFGVLQPTCLRVIRARDRFLLTTTTTKTTPEKTNVNLDCYICTVVYVWE